MEELEFTMPKPGPRLVAAGAASLLLVLAGLLYAWYGLIPLLLDYLTHRRTTGGALNRMAPVKLCWFIVNLLSASAIGFQAPLLTMLVLRSGIATRQQLSASRRMIWFGAFVLGAFMSPTLSLFLVAPPSSSCSKLPCCGINHSRLSRSASVVDLTGMFPRPRLPRTNRENQNQRSRPCPA